MIQGCAITTMILNVIALWKQETRDRNRRFKNPDQPTFKQSWELFCKGDHAIRRLTAVGLGTMAFTMEDVLLEPYGGEILKLSVSSTTFSTATLAIGFNSITRNHQFYPFGVNNTTTRNHLDNNTKLLGFPGVPVINHLHLISR